MTCALGMFDSRLETVMSILWVNSVNVTYLCGCHSRTHYTALLVSAWGHVNLMPLLRWVDGVYWMALAYSRRYTGRV